MPYATNKYSLVCSTREYVKDNLSLNDLDLFDGVLFDLGEADG
jgi:hypothetical protein